MKVLTNLTARNHKFKPSVNKGESQTIPDQAISIQELLRRYATGQPLGLKNAEPVYDDPDLPDIPELYKMDATDRLHAMQENSRELTDLHSQYENEVQEQKQTAEKLKKAKLSNNSSESAGSSEATGESETKASGAATKAD